MEALVVHSSSWKQSHGHKASSGNDMDIWSIAHDGSVPELDSALLQLKRNNGSIDARNSFGLTPLHIAVWRNHVPIVKRLLAAGADPNSRDGESGWTSLHRALHFGHLAVAGVLLSSGASITIEDSKARIPVDLLSGPVCQTVGTQEKTAVTELFSWGNGSNYQLGNGNTEIQKLPCKVESFHGTRIKIIAAAKFHSVAVSTSGELYTWGFGRGGRLGHPDFDIHSGQAAVITPRQLNGWIGSRRVRSVAAAKHHTVVATEGGDVYTWGSNREGQLGYPSVDTQPTPRRVTSLRGKIIAVAAANKHTAVVSETGEVFTWGCNKEGQLGYGTSNSASNYTPRLVEYLKGKQFVGVSAAKYHTVVLGVDGEVFTWGNRLVNPRRVIIARNTKKYGSASLKFHRAERLHVVSIAAGMVHTTALTSDGALFFWWSSDPNLKCRQLYSTCGKSFVNISAGKYWTVAVTTIGDVYMWDGKKNNEVPAPSRVHGIRNATAVSVGEAHLLALCALYHPPYPLESAEPAEVLHQKNLEELDVDFMFHESQEASNQFLRNNDRDKSVPSLKSLCEKAACESLVEPRNAIQLLEVADALEADELRKFCEDLVLHNLNFISSLLTPMVANTSPEVLAKLEKALDARSSESWSYRRLPTPTATFPAIVESEEDESDSGCPTPRYSHSATSNRHGAHRAGDGFLMPQTAAEQAISKQVRAIKKKLQQIDILEEKLAKGQSIDDQQKAKLKTRQALETLLVELGVPLDIESVKESAGSQADGKANKKGLPKKQKRRTKRDNLQEPTNDGDDDDGGKLQSVNGFPDIKSISDMKANIETDLSSGIQSIESRIGDLLLDNLPLTATKRSSSKKSKKKGGLSVFLSGALDDNAKVVITPPTPKVEGPAWGGIKVSKGPTSLRDIQQEQKMTDESSPVGKIKPSLEKTASGKSIGQMKLGSFFPGSPSSPVAIAASRSNAAATQGEKSTPPWAAAGASPVLSRPSLRDIQVQQEKKQTTLISHSPKTRTQGFSIGSPDSGSKEAAPNRWYKPDAEAPSSIRSIQIEEAAIKDLKRYYGSVKLVRKLEVN